MPRSRDPALFLLAVLLRLRMRALSVFPVGVRGELLADSEADPLGETDVPLEVFGALSSLLELPDEVLDVVLNPCVWIVSIVLAYLRIVNSEAPVLETHFL